MEPKELKIEYVPIGAIVPYANNAKLHPDEQIEEIKTSITRYGFNDPIAVWQDTIVEGHGRLIAATELGMEAVPIIRLDHMTDEERRAYMLVHNKATMDSGFDTEALNKELEDLADMDMSAFGFEELHEVIEAMDLDDEPEEKKEGETYKCPKCGFVFEVRK